MAVTFPAAMLLLDFWPLMRFSQPAAAGPLIREKIPMLALAILASLIAVITHAIPVRFRALHNCPSPRMENAAMAYCAYLAQTFWPAGLAAFYPYPIQRNATCATLCGSLLIIVSAAVVVLRSSRRIF